MLLPLFRALGWWPQRIQAQSKLLPLPPLVLARRGCGEVGSVAREGRVLKHEGELVFLLSSRHSRALRGFRQPLRCPWHVYVVRHFGLKNARSAHPAFLVILKQLPLQLTLKCLAKGHKKSGLF